MGNRERNEEYEKLMDMFKNWVSRELNKFFKYVERELEKMWKQKYCSVGGKTYVRGDAGLHFDV